MSVNVDVTSKQIGNNPLLLGAQLHYWHKLDGAGNAILRTQVAEAHLKYLRFFIRWGRYDGPYPQDYGPCQSWDEATKTGTWEWSVFDAVISAIYETGAIPILCLNLGFPPEKVPPGMTLDPDLDIPYPDSFAAYAQAVAQHCKDNGWTNIIWEVGNEWFGRWTFWPYNSIYTPENEAKWAKLTATFNAVAEAIHTVIPGAKVGEANSIHKGWCEHFAQNAIGETFIGYHKYDSGNAPEEYATDEQLFQFAVNGMGMHSGHPELRWTINEALDIFASQGKNREFYITETALNHDWSPQDYRKFSELGATWYVTELIDFILNRGVNISIFYELASGKDAGGPTGYGLVELWGDHTPRYPYYANMLIGSYLARGDPLLETLVSDETTVSAVTWVHGGRAKLVLTNKRPTLTEVSINGLSGAATLYRIDKSILGIQQEAVTLPATIAMDGYTVILLDAATPTPPIMPIAGPIVTCMILLGIGMERGLV